MSKHLTILEKFLQPESGIDLPFSYADAQERGDAFIDTVIKPLERELDNVFLEFTKILNDPSLTWKVKRAVLREKFKLDEETIRELVPEPPYLEPS